MNYENIQFETKDIIMTTNNLKKIRKVVLENLQLEKNKNL